MTDNNKKQPPVFSNIEGGVTFRDTHSVADYWEGMQSVQVNFKVKKSGGYSKVLSVRLDEETYARINEEARKKGVGPTTLARMVLFEKYRPRVV